MLIRIIHTYTKGWGKNGGVLCTKHVVITEIVTEQKL